MFINKASIVFSFFLTINSTICLKSTDLCTLKQKECKGFYDEQENYHIECNLVKCHGSFNGSFRPGPSILSSSLLHL